jgi:hypothetical protein
MQASYETHADLSEVPLYTHVSLFITRRWHPRSTPNGAHCINQSQEYIAHQKPQYPRTLQKAYAWGPTMVLEGGRFLII